MATTPIKQNQNLADFHLIPPSEIKPIVSIYPINRSYGFKLSHIRNSKSLYNNSANSPLSDHDTEQIASQPVYTSPAIKSNSRQNTLNHRRLPLLNARSGQEISLKINDSEFETGLNQQNPLKLFSNRTGSDCPTFDIYHPGFYLYAQHSSDMPFQNLNAKNAELVEYVQKRKDTESAAYSFSTTLGVGYMFDNGIIAESGVSLDRINMKFHHLDENAIKNSTVITIDTMILNDIDTIIQIDTMIVQQTGIKEVTSYNSFTQIDIPLVLGYEFPLSKRFRLSLKGGVMINIRSSNKGNMLGLNDFPVAYGSNNNNDNTYFKTNIGFSYTGGLNLEADINHSFSLYAGANIRYYPNSFSLPSNQVNEKYTKFGLMTGIKYRL